MFITQMLSTISSSQTIPLKIQRKWPSLSHYDFGLNSTFTHVETAIHIWFLVPLACNIFHPSTLNQCSSLPLRCLCGQQIHGSRFKFSLVICVFFINYIYLTHVSVGTHMCHSIHAEVTVQLLGVILYFPPPCGLQRSNSGGLTARSFTCWVISSVLIYDFCLDNWDLQH